MLGKPSWTARANGIEWLRRSGTWVDFRRNPVPDINVSQADQIRKFVLEGRITPARASGQLEVTVRAGDVHRAMGLQNAMPAVCSALRSSKFAELAAVGLRQTLGPANGANVHFSFDLDSPAKSSNTRAMLENLLGPSTKASTGLDFSGALILVSCVKSKLPHSAEARHLYTSAWFSKVRGLVEHSGAPWFVLSSLYGLVSPDRSVEPYDYTLNTLGVEERRAWATKVLSDLLPRAHEHQRVIMFAGSRYREFLVGPLQHAGIVVEVPLEQLRLGEQLSWLSANS